MFTNFLTQKIAIVSVINDLATDQRVQRTCNVLIEKGYSVILIGRILPGSLAVDHLPYRCIRMSVFFKKGPIFYLIFNFRLFLSLIFKKTDLLIANDLDTLLPNYLVSKLKNVKLIYDSHEIFTEVPELADEPIKKRIWKSLENYVIPKLKHCITVNDSIAEYFFKEYK
ncbi:MAG: glycosyltransferase, partial [Bacteroidota bacterium]